MTTPDTTAVDAARMTRAQRAALPLSTDVAQALAEQHGVCVRPLAMRRIDTSTGRVDVLPVALLVASADGEILRANAAAVELFGPQRALHGAVQRPQPR